MFNGPFEIYEDYQIVPKPILSESATKAIEFYVQIFSESIPYVWAHEDLFSRPTDKQRPSREPERNS